MTKTTSASLVIADVVLVKTQKEIFMLIINLTEELDFRFDSQLVEECLSEREFKHRTHMFYHSRYVEFYSSAIPFVNSHLYDSVKPILEQIPIYLVSTEQAHQTVNVAYWGRVESIVVPEDKYEKGTVNEEGLFDSYAMIDLLGLYHRDVLTSVNGCAGIENIKPNIFIWVDKIFDYVKAKTDRNDYEDDFHYECALSRRFDALTSEVILHELMHALMDNLLLGFGRHNIPIKRFMGRFDTYKEESLANAMALELMEHHLRAEDWDFIIDFVKHQPDEYSLGLEYLSLPVFSYAEEWVSHKDGHSFDSNVIQAWFSYVEGAKPLDKKQLKALEYGLGFTGGLFKYNGVFYNNHDVCVNVIKDYANNHSVTRSDLHNAFPNSLNNNYEAMIDYPQTKEFHDKRDGSTRSISVENIIHCTDGDVVVCDYWHPEDMPGFVQNARQMGIRIDTF